MASACPNPHLLYLVDRGWARLAALRSSVFSFVPQRAAPSVEEHEALIDLIAAGAPAEDVERAAREHRRRTLDGVLGLGSARRPTPDAAPAASPAVVQPHGLDPVGQPL